jgi:micrococcal nuclease
MKRLPLLISLFLLLACSLPAVAQVQPTVVSTGDGDTLRLNQNGKRLTVRLGCIDAPEGSQRPWGPLAATRLKTLLPPGQVVRVRQIDRDRYGRTVAELFSGNQSVNLQLVREGFAVVYPQYLSGCAATKDQYLSAEAAAKRQGLGVWNPQNRMTVMPWDYRKQRRSR